MAESPENVTAAPAPPVPAPAPATKPSPPARSGIPPRYDLDAKWDAFLDLSIHRVSYSSHASAFRGLILFLDDKKYKGSIYMDHDLTGLADRPGMRFTMPQIKCYMKQLFTGLHYCHVNQVLHRDIKDSSSTSCSFTVQATSDEDDHRDLHGDEEAPHIVELDGTTVPRSGAAELGQRLRLHGPRPPRWLLARVNKSSQGRDSVTTIYSNSNPWTASTRTKTSDASSSLPRTRYSICASSRNLLCTAKSMRRSAHCSTISLLNWEEERLKIVVVPLLQKLKCEV